MKIPKLSSIVLAGVFSFCNPVQAATINWGNTVFDTLVDSNGAALDNSFNFEIGIFTGGFVPTASNLTDWGANWRIFDASPLSTDPLNGSGPPVNFFTSSAIHRQDGTSDSPDTTLNAVFPQNSRAYLWVYDSKAVSFTSEWALFTDLDRNSNAEDEWVFPNPSDITLLLDWILSDADTAIFGKLKNGTIVGGGDFTSTPTTFELQTHQVPEPGGALLIASAGLLFMLRRARFISQNR